MPITYDITKDSLYLEGLEKGEGMGIEKNRRQMIINALKLGKLSIEEIAEMAEVEVTYVSEIKEQLVQE